MSSQLLQQLLVKVSEYRRQLWTSFSCAGITARGPFLTLPHAPFHLPATGTATARGCSQQRVTSLTVSFGAIYCPWRDPFPIQASCRSRRAPCKRQRLRISTQRHPQRLQLILGPLGTGSQPSLRALLPPRGTARAQRAQSRFSRWTAWWASSDTAG